MSLICCLFFVHNAFSHDKFPERVPLDNPLRRYEIKGFVVFCLFDNLLVLGSLLNSLSLGLYLRLHFSNLCFELFQSSSFLLSFRFLKLEVTLSLLVQVLVNLQMVLKLALFVLQVVLLEFVRFRFLNDRVKFLGCGLVPQFAHLLLKMSPGLLCHFLTEDLIELRQCVISRLARYLLQAFLVMLRPNLLHQLVRREKLLQDAILVLDLVVIRVLLADLQFVQNGDVAVTLENFAFECSPLLYVLQVQVWVVVDAAVLGWQLLHHVQLEGVLVGLPQELSQLFLGEYDLSCRVPQLPLQPTALIIVAIFL